MIPFPSALLSVRRAAATAAPALSLDFTNGIYAAGAVTSGSIADLPGFAFVRSGEQGAADADGTVRWFEADRPAIDGNGFHAYGATTNLIVRSQEIDDPAWSKVGANGAVPPTVGANSGLAPDGTASAERVIFGDSANASSLSLIAPNSEAFFIQPAVHTLSIFAKGALGGERMFLGQTDNGATFTGADQQVTDTYRRHHVVLASVPGVVIAGHDRRTGQEARPSESIDLWQAQLLAGAFADGGPLIRTAGAAASIGASELRLALANGDYVATFTFDDGSEQVLPMTVGGGQFVHPVMGALNRGVVRRTVVTRA